MDLELAIINYAYYENDKGPVWIAKCRDKDRNPYFIQLQDERIDPVFYILKSDFEFFKKTAKSLYLWHLVKRYEKGVPTYWDEETVAIYTKYPRNIKKLRERIKTIPYFNADIKYEKKVAQQLKLGQYIRVKNYKKWEFTKLEDIEPADVHFKVEQNICYWDIEIKGNKLPSLKNAFKTPELYEIISYVTYNPFKNLYIYYGFKSEWKDEVYEEEYNSEMNMSKKVEKHPMMVNYPLKSKVIVKKFKREEDMHRTFLEDFGDGDFDGICMFNGRGGNIINKTSGGNREWRNGFDMPMFYARCEHLGIKKEIQKLSPIPVSSTWKKPVMQYRTYERGEWKKNEIHIDCIPQHDIYFDNVIFKFTKDQSQMKDEKLDTYLWNFLGITKVKHDDMVWEMFEKDWEKEKYYNIVDVEGMFALDKYFSFTEQVWGRASLYCGKQEDVIYVSKLHDHIYMWYCSGKYCMDIQKQTRGRWRGFIDKKMGGHNQGIEMGTLLGYLDDAFGIIIDFSKLYPSCYMTANADIRTKVEFDHYEDDGNIIVDRFGIKYKRSELTTPPSGFFRKDVKALNTIIYETLISERTKQDMKKADYLSKAAAAKTKADKEFYLNMAKIHEVNSFSYKGLINGKFGADGLESGRTFDMVIYNTSPSMGQEILKYLLYTLLPKHGYNPFFASTDSAMIKVNAKTAWGAWYEGQRLCEKINEELDDFIQEKYNPIHNYIKIGLEKVFSQCILFNKRMYILKTVIEDTKKGPVEMDPPKVYIRGLEYLKNNTSMIVTDVQRKLLEMFINNEERETIQKFLIEEDRKFEKHDWEYIAPIGSISRNPDEYKKTFQKAEACRNANMFCGKDYKAMDRPYLGLFREVPSHVNWISKDVLYRDKDGCYPIAFDEGDREKLEPLGFVLDYDAHKKLTIASVKIDRFLQLVFGQNYWEFIVEDADPCEV